jgi:two-component system, OmpR family, response regulator
MTPNGADKPEARLLVVDDEPNIVELLSASLRYAGFQVDVARSGPEAVRVARQVNPDLLVLDVMMPGMDGWETCERLKAQPATADIPIIMLTSLDGVDVPARAREAGAIAVLMKPCPPERLIMTIEAARRALVPNDDSPPAPAARTWRPRESISGDAWADGWYPRPVRTDRSRGTADGFPE